MNIIIITSILLSVSHAMPMILTLRTVVGLTRACVSVCVRVCFNCFTTATYQSKLHSNNKATVVLWISLMLAKGACAPSSPKSATAWHLHQRRTTLWVVNTPSSFHNWKHYLLCQVCSICAKLVHVDHTNYFQFEQVFNPLAFSLTNLLGLKTF